MNTKNHLCFCLGVLLALGPVARLHADDTPVTPDPAYIKVTHERAAKIVATLGLTETNKAAGVEELIARQYQDLSRIHGGRDQRIKEIQSGTTDKAESEAKVKEVRGEAQIKLDALHKEYLAKLSAELTSEQVDKVKDGMTYGVVPLTYGVYLKMYPDLTADQKAQVKAWLIEAREIAMDGSTSNEKHGVFGKYKGRINNYLVKQGYDLKQGGENLKKTSAPASGTKSE